MIAPLPPIGTRCLARETPGWEDRDLDPDLCRELTGDEPVELQWVGLTDAPNLDADQVREYRDLYRDGGPNAMPPLWAWEGGRFPMLITGSHRSAAAIRAGLEQLPAWVVVD